MNKPYYESKLRLEPSYAKLRLQSQRITKEFTPFSFHIQTIHLHGDTLRSGLIEIFETYATLAEKGKLNKVSVERIIRSNQIRHYSMKFTEISPNEYIAYDGTAKPLKREKYEQTFKEVFLTNEVFLLEYIDKDGFKTMREFIIHDFNEKRFRGLTEKGLRTFHYDKVEKLSIYPHSHTLFQSSLIRIALEDGTFTIEANKAE